MTDNTTDSTYVSKTANTNKMTKKRTMEAIAAQGSHFGRVMRDILRLSLNEAGHFKNMMNENHSTTHSHFKTFFIGRSSGLVGSFLSLNRKTRSRILITPRSPPR